MAFENRAPWLGAAVALLASSCYREMSAQPFHIAAVAVASGLPLETADQRAGLIALRGTVQRDAASASPAFVIDDPVAGAVRVFFANAAAPVVRLPEVPHDGEAAAALLQYDPAGTGPAGEELRYPALRLGQAAAPGAAADQWRLALGESAVRLGDGRPAIPALLGPLGAETTSDLPAPGLVRNTVDFEPTRCGDLYRHRLVVVGPDRTLAVAEGEEGLLPGPAAGLPAWTVHHVAGWSVGANESGGCAAPRSWVQFALWR